MNSLTFFEGDGRLLRSERAVVYAEEPLEALFALFADDRSVDFKAVASIVVANNFEMPSFVVLAMDTARLFVFGNLEIRLGDEHLSGSESDTWIEREVDLSIDIATGARSNIRGDLTRGWVSAGGFHLVAAGNGESSELQKTEEFQTPDPKPQEPAVEIVQAAPSPADEAASGVTEPADGVWDPLADPDIDLERIGEQEVIDAVPPSPPPTQPSSAQPSPAQPSHEPIEPLTDVADGTSTDNLYMPEDTRDTQTPPPSQQSAPIPPPPTPIGVAPPPPSPLAHIPPPPGSQALTKALPTIPAPAEFQPSTVQPSERGNIRFDDGQSATVNAGIYVGRHPTKNGIPDHYTSVTIRGEHVSRLHFELVIEGDAAVVRDLGSNSGTEVEINGRRITVPAGGMQISPGAKIIFADRWAIYETE